MGQFFQGNEKKDTLTCAAIKKTWRMNDVRKSQGNRQEPPTVGTDGHDLSCSII